MSQTIVQSIVKRILTDKIFASLIIAGVLVIIFVAFATDVPSDKAKPDAQQAAQREQSPQAQTAAAQLNPQLAIDFVRWWLTKSMDYNVQTARDSHNEAAKWMTQTAGTSFQAGYWNQQIQQGVLSGQVSAAFQPMSIFAEAVNPDGSIVVGITGTLLLQQGGPPMSQQVAMDFLVVRDANGLRIGGVYNRQVANAQTGTQAPY
jgi:hypothetical protein